MANPSIGTVICPICGDLADVRKDKNGKLYYSGEAGLITPRTPSGQKWMREHMVSDESSDAKAQGNDDFDTQVDEHETTANEPSFLERLANWGADDE
ncbi:hypothetical protein [Vibrio viridaestus]|uniref:Uncharacterized protein n=1 Tax=Vibrio viridaestus TaxID=2487322 RepID=A0A3N9TC28_9VIBR|nr:hypothetical protein [Vibrio viridaestus]RQW61025.1 hypothetical protein EES38_21490 [Vibrio viridaestus]